MADQNKDILLERMQIMFDFAPLVISFLSVDLKHVVCNEEAVRLFDLSCKEEFIERFHELSPEYQPDGSLSSEQAFVFINKAFTDGYVKFEWMHQKFTGELIPTEIILIRTEHDNELVLTSYLKDLRDLKSVIAEKDEALERNQVLLDSTPLSAVFWDEQCKILGCNQEAVNLFGFSTKEALVDNFYQLSPEYQPDGMLSSERMQILLNKVFEEGYAEFEWLHQGCDGKPIPTEVTLVRMKHRGTFIAASYMNDLRELTFAVEEKNVATERIQIMLDSMPLCANFWDENYNNIDCNQEAVRIFELSSKREYLDRFLDLSPEYQPDGILSAEKAKIYIEKAFQDGAAQFEWLHKKLNGEPMPAEITLVRVKLKDRFIVVGYTRDMRELKAMLQEIHKTEDELRRARDLAEERAKTKSEFLANMSHEIRTPINAILGMTYIVLDSELTAKQRDFIEKAQYSAQLLLRIVNDILDFSKIEAGHFTIEHIDFSLHKMLNNFMNIVGVQTSTQSLSLTMNIDPTVPDIICGDPLRLEQILMNLVSNALKFTKNGGIEIHITPTKKKLDSEEQLEIVFEVIDTGIGMSQAQIDLLFSPFIQADSSTTRKYGGTGLGLAISLSLAKLMGGTIWCESEVGVGSKFSFALVFSLTCKGTLNEVAETVSTSQLTLGIERDTDFSCLQGMTVLLAEDNEINQLIAEELLLRKGIIVDTVANGLEALEAVQGKKYDLVLMDIQMPEMDGLTATKVIRTFKEFADLPIIAMTAHALSGDREISLNIGMNDHITKPIFPDMLYAMLKHWQK